MSLVALSAEGMKVFKQLAYGGLAAAIGGSAVYVVMSNKNSDDDTANDEENRSVQADSYQRETYQKIDHEERAVSPLISGIFSSKNPEECLCVMVDDCSKELKADRSIISSFLLRTITVGWKNKAKTVADYQECKDEAKKRFLFSLEEFRSSVRNDIREEQLLLLSTVGMAFEHCVSDLRDWRLSIYIQVQQEMFGSLVPAIGSESNQLVLFNQNSPIGKLTVNCNSMINFNGAMVQANSMPQQFLEIAQQFAKMWNRQDNRIKGLEQQTQNLQQQMQILDEQRDDRVRIIEESHAKVVNYSYKDNLARFDFGKWKYEGDDNQKLNSANGQGIFSYDGFKIKGTYTNNHLKLNSPIIVSRYSIKKEFQVRVQNFDGSVDMNDLAEISEAALTKTGLFAFTTKNGENFVFSKDYFYKGQINENKRPEGVGLLITCAGMKYDGKFKNRFFLVGNATSTDGKSQAIKEENPVSISVL